MYRLCAAYIIGIIDIVEDYPKLGYIQRITMTVKDKNQNRQGQSLENISNYINN